MRKFFILLFVLILADACGGQGKMETKKKAAPIPKARISAVFLTQGVPPEIIQKGADASEKLLKTLKTQLIAAMQEKGLEGALDFCSSNAQKLTNEVNVSYQGTLDIKRTSLKFRNPADKPDKFEEQALHLLQKNIAASKTPPNYLVQKITGNKTTRYRYYKPILINSACLGCHGNEKKIKPSILEKIRKKYPDGTATGYMKGQLRGMVRVEMKAPGTTSAM